MVVFWCTTKLRMPCDFWKGRQRLWEVWPSAEVGSGNPKKAFCASEIWVHCEYLWHHGQRGSEVNDLPRPLIYDFRFYPFGTKTEENLLNLADKPSHNSEVLFLRSRDGFTEVTWSTDKTGYRVTMVDSMTWSGDQCHMQGPPWISGVLQTRHLFKSCIFNQAIFRNLRGVCGCVRVSPPCPLRALVESWSAPWPTHVLTLNLWTMQCRTHTILWEGLDGPLGPCFILHTPDGVFICAGIHRPFWWGKQQEMKCFNSLGEAVWLDAVVQNPVQGPPA